MNLKKLTQAVFDGLPPEYLWAAVDEDGETYAHAVKPECHFYSGRWVQPIIRGSLALFGGDHDATDWQNSLIKRQDVPTADIDWSAAPQGATHATYDDDYTLWLKQQPSGSWLAQSALGDVWDKLSGEPEGFVFERPKTQVDWSAAPEGATHYAIQDGVVCWLKDDYSFWNVWEDGVWAACGIPVARRVLNRSKSIHDVARSIEAARIEEQAERTYPHYFKDVSAVDAIDLYHVARLYDITDPALFHAFKKIACAGKRGAKDQAQDVQEAIDALKRWQELNV